MIKKRLIFHPLMPFSFQLTIRFLKAFDPTIDNYKIYKDKILFGINQKDQIIGVTMHELNKNNEKLIVADLNIDMN
ncbi:hypothetical protein [Bombilactobacillus bombi]|uniref:hypothetical protein n=1 Tax=Bombilactobacillus bombi TaxID=1303590 RepID=UPI0015E5A02A|nr:hypothetical protein [Bombilactobacillus bombi]MBA1435220.1 hypothetical protein [Bombilactobacillus bombi]